MAEAYATVDDYTARTPGPSLTDQQRVQVDALLVDASAIMRGKVPAGIVPDPDTARAICVKIVKRAVINAGGRRSRTIGGYAETLTDSGGLYITDEEINDLLGDTSASGDGAYTVPLYDQARYWPGHYSPYDPYDPRFC